MRLTIAFLYLPAVWSGASAAGSPADAINGLKKKNTDLCVQVGRHVPDAPKNPKLVAPYCGCVSEAYWQSVPTAEQQALVRKGTSPGVEKNRDARMAAAQVACKKKIGVLTTRAGTHWPSRWQACLIPNAERSCGHAGRCFECFFMENRPIAHMFAALVAIYYGAIDAISGAVLSTASRMVKTVFTVF